MTREEIMQLNTDYLNGCESEHKMNELFSYVLSQEPKTGHWRAVYQGDEIINYRCSECELGDTNGSTNLYGWDYCRRCGARMERSEKE